MVLGQPLSQPTAASKTAATNTTNKVLGHHEIIFVGPDRARVCATASTTSRSAGRDFSFSRRLSHKPLCNPVSRRTVGGPILQKLDPPVRWDGSSKSVRSCSLSPTTRRGAISRRFARQPPRGAALPFGERREIDATHAMSAGNVACGARFRVGVCRLALRYSTCTEPVLRDPGRRRHGEHGLRELPLTHLGVHSESSAKRG